MLTDPVRFRPIAKHDLVRVFLDCNHCDESYLKKEIFNNIVNPRFGGGG